MPRTSGGKRKKTRTHDKGQDPNAIAEEEESVPKSFIIKRGKIGMYLKDLLTDLRELMYPFTATKLQESKKNSIKDYISAAGMFGVSHMMILTQTEQGNYLRVLKNPRGPTITFKIEEYALAKDIIKFGQDNKRNSKIFAKTLQSAPLMIMNGFSQKPEGDVYKIVSLMLQSMFPAIKISSMNLSTCKRVVLFNLVKGNKEDDEDPDQEYIEFRHYGVSARQRSVNRAVKKIVNAKNAPNLAKFNDIADYILNQGRKYNGSGGANSGAYSSESEADDLPDSRVVLPEDYQDKKKNTSVAIRLHELGPRLKLKLIKVEEGICRGNVVFHSYNKKSPAEIKKQLDGLKSKRELKEKRKREQDENIKKKAEKKEEAKLRSKGINIDETKNKVKNDKESDQENVEGADVDDTTLNKPNKSVLGKRKAPESKEPPKSALKKRRTK